MYNINRKMFSLLIVNTVCDDINSRTFGDKFNNISVRNQVFPSQFCMFFMQT